MNSLLLIALVVLLVLFMWQNVLYNKSLKKVAKKSNIIAVLTDDLERFETEVRELTDDSNLYHSHAAYLRGKIERLEAEITQFCKENQAAERFWQKIAKRRVKN
jgi:peptidoglycan hydrolase CwlO-like protein